MNTNRLPILLTTLFLCLGLGFSSGCSSTAVYQMDSGERTAGAEGQVSVDRDRNGNQVVNLRVAHLPMPSRLEEGMSTYVVWVFPNDSRTAYNVGQMRLRDDRTAEINFTTPFRTFNMVVTAEVDSQVMSPSNQVVLRRAVGGN